MKRSEQLKVKRHEAGIKFMLMISDENAVGGIDENGLKRSG